MRLLKLYAVVSTSLALILSVSAFTKADSSGRFTELTVTRLNVVDSTGKTRVILAGGYPPRRSALAGLLFMNEDGQEAGGLVYQGSRDSKGNIRAGAILTFDQYQNDQILALSYDHSDNQKRQGLTIQDRPDSLSDLVKEAYRAIEGATTAAMRDSLRRYYQTRIPPENFLSRRLFVGRDYSRASLVTLSDVAGRPRLRLQVDSLGAASITFLDATGRAVRTITP